MELELFLKDVAQAFESTGNAKAETIAHVMSQLKVGSDLNIRSNGSIPTSLEPALKAADCHPAAQRLNEFAHQLPWISARGFRQAPESFIGNYHFVAIVGPNDIVQSNQFRFGIFLQNAETFYPSHKHEAEELYFPLSGTALWQKDSNEFEPKPVGQLIHHLSYQPHATHTQNVPMLAIWAWLGNLSPNTYSYV